MLTFTTTNESFFQVVNRLYVTTLLLAMQVQSAIRDAKLFGGIEHERQARQTLHLVVRNIYYCVMNRFCPWNSNTICHLR